MTGQAPRIALIAHTPSPNTKRLAQAAREGIVEHSGCTVDLKGPLDADAESVLAADALILGTTENFGYMAGAMKDFFDRTYYSVLGKTEGLPYAIYIRAGLDGTGTRRAMTSIIGGLGWKAIAKPTILRGEWNDEFVTQCRELGATLGVGMEMGIY